MRRSHTTSIYPCWLQPCRIWVCGLLNFHIHWRLLNPNVCSIFEILGIKHIRIRGVFVFISYIFVILFFCIFFGACFLVTSYYIISCIRLLVRNCLTYNNQPLWSFIQLYVLSFPSLNRSAFTCTSFNLYHVTFQMCSYKLLVLTMS